MRKDIQEDIPCERYISRATRLAAGALGAIIGLALGAMTAITAGAILVLSVLLLLLLMLLLLMLTDLTISDGRYGGHALVVHNCLADVRRRNSAMELVPLSAALRKRPSQLAEA